ncbi:MAG: tetratricopeptide repeat protein [Caulobacterales bacterium]
MAGALAIAAIGLASLCGSAALAAEPATGAATEAPWSRAKAAVDATESDIRTGGILAVRNHLADLEQALAAAPRPAPQMQVIDGRAYVLVDGQAQALLATLTASAAPQPAGDAPREVVAVDDPYLMVSFYLGSYYNEVGQSSDALRVLDAGLAIEPRGWTLAGSHHVAIVTERGAAHIASHNLIEALADYDGGLALQGVAPRDRARLLRGRGYALTELKRYDEAEDAYRQSLALEPGNSRAESELQYIARVKAGGPTAPGGIISVQHPPAASGGDAQSAQPQK